MNLKPPDRPAGMAGWQSRVTRLTRLKALIAAGGISLGFVGVGLATSGPAMADPAVNYIVGGSDTTQDVMEGFALTTGNVVGSYNAVNPVTAAAGEIITPVKVPVGAVTPQLNCSYARPNGSGSGFAALDFSITGTSLPGLLTPGPAAGCIDVARSSSPPGSFAQSGAGAADPAGQLIYIPFALDALAGAVGPTTNITNAGMFTLTQLRGLYASCTPQLVNGVTYDPNSPVGTGNTQIDLYIPQSGSGTFKFWQQNVGDDTACVHQTILTGPNAGQAVEEHDGTDVASDPNGYTPFSIAQWVAQKNGFDDRRHGAVLQAINGVSPLTPTGTLNTAFPITREVYNVVAFDRVVNTGDGKFDPTLAGLLAGTGSLLCSSNITIRTYGFATLGQPSTTDNCGAVTNSLRVDQ